MSTANAAIVSMSGDIVALINETDVRSGAVQYAWETANALGGGEVLVNARHGKLTRAKKILESWQALECMSTARCVDDTTVYPRFLIS